MYSVWNKVKQKLARFFCPHLKVQGSLFGEPYDRWCISCGTYLGKEKKRT